MFLVYGDKGKLRVKGYKSSSFQTDKDNSCSQSGWMFLLNGGVFTWKSLKPKTVEDSTCESKYVAASESTK